MSEEFISYLEELLQDFGPIHARRMFGGYGIYHDGLMFALIADDTLYLKTDEQNRAAFETLGLPAFRYQKQGKEISMSYTQAPADMLEAPTEAAYWARLAYAAALRARKPKR
ncbi:TfoX/Sxy family protein [Methylobacillus arboreus]|uniref:TfoX/Sxy family protein n=1 Tax=Methylobacillus arboreus TaxID=755170 RepID=UPI001E55097A|nr:TfoX/Sxy family protein [Methylobacillus arboreus]MCB5189405.1 TfoX/Sxy family protein [Methylobacillus arboreus]